MAGSARDEPAWDFFVSYTQADQAWAEWIAWLLEEDGYRVLVQAWDMVAGSNWISRMDQVGLSEDVARRRLRDEIAAAMRGRAKPGSPPPFTGRSGALDGLDLDLRSDALHRVAESELSVRPRQPRVLQSPATFWDAQQISLPGRDAPLVGRNDELMRLGTALAPAAHSPMNRGLAAMVGDPRFAGVIVVLTVRPGLAEQTLWQAGLDQVEPTTITLDPLGRSEINEIVAAHGIADQAFHLHVVDIAEGNPLIAHAACEIAIQQGTYSWQDTTSVLRDLFKNRLSHISADEHEHRATAVALAVLTTAQSGEQLAALVDAVQGLPPDPHRLHGILIDLADAGIVDGPPYTLRPDVLGPVIVADALADGQRVNVDLARTLRALGPAASWGVGAGEGSDNPGLLGICRPKAGAKRCPPRGARNCAGVTDRCSGAGRSPDGTSRGPLHAQPRGAGGG